MKTRPLLIALVLTFLLSLVPTAAARTPRGTRITGTIQKVDDSAREVEMRREDNGTLIAFTWSKLTTFVTSTSMVDAAILRKGARVEVTRHVPLFGKPLVTKVTLLPDTAQRSK